MIFDIFKNKKENTKLEELDTEEVDFVNLIREVKEKRNKFKNNHTFYKNRRKWYNEYANCHSLIE